MPGTKKKPSAARRAEIVAAAQNILSQRGPSALSLRSVAEAVNIKHASLQYHFPTYAQLIDAMVDASLDAYAERLDATAIGAAVSPERRLESVFEQLILGEPGDGLLSQLHVQLWALAQTDPDVRASLSRHHRLYLAFLEEVIGAARSDLNPDQIHGLSVSIASMIEGSTLFVDLAEPSAPIEQRAQSVLAAALALVKAYPATVS